MKSYAAVNVRITPEQAILVESLKEEGITQAMIFRRGLEHYAPKVPRKTMNRTRKSIGG